MKNSISVATLPVISKNLGSKQAKKDENPAPVQTDSGPTPPISDSLRWFGILVPPALRACQSSFRHAVTETVPALAEVADEMKSLEIEIRRTRKKIRKAG